MFLISMFSLVMWNFILLWISMECMLVCFSMKLIKNLNSFFYIFFVSEFSFSLFFLFGFLLQTKLLLIFFIVGKMGIFPMWFWVIRLFEEEKMNIVVNIFSLYKIIPMVILIQEIKMSKFLILLLLLNLMSSFLLLIFYDNMKMFMCFVFISSMGFLLLSSMEEEMFFLYFLMYFFSLLVVLIDLKTNKAMFLALFVFLIFYSGIPPFPSFFLKILVVLKFTDMSFMLSLVLWSMTIILICALWMLFVLVNKQSIWFSFMFFSLLVILLKL